MDLQRLRLALNCTQSIVQSLEDANTSDQTSTPALQGELLRSLRQMQIAVQGTDKYIQTLRAEVSLHSRSSGVCANMDQSLKAL